jgi:hypothetical protein
MEQTNQITIDVRLNFNDILRADRLYRASSSNRYQSDRVFGFLALFFGILEWVIIFLWPGQEQTGVDLSYVLASVLCLGGLAFIYDWIPAARLWLQYRSYSQLYTQPYQASFDEHGMTVEKENASSTFKWGYYQAAVEGSKEFILIYGKDLYYTIPKTSFQSQGDIEAFRTILRNNLAYFKQMLKLPMDFRRVRSAT